MGFERFDLFAKPLPQLRHLVVSVSSTQMQAVAVGVSGLQQLQRFDCAVAAPRSTMCSRNMLRVLEALGTLPKLSTVSLPVEVLLCCCTPAAAAGGGGGGRRGGTARAASSSGSSSTGSSQFCCCCSNPQHSCESSRVREALEVLVAKPSVTKLVFLDINWDIRRPEEREDQKKGSKGSKVQVPQGWKLQGLRYLRDIRRVGEAAGPAAAVAVASRPMTRRRIEQQDQEQQEEEEQEEKAEPQGEVAGAGKPSITVFMANEREWSYPRACTWDWGHSVWGVFCSCREVRGSDIYEPLDW